MNNKKQHQQTKQTKNRDDKYGKRKTYLRRL